MTNPPRQRFQGFLPGGWARFQGRSAPGNPPRGNLTVVPLRREEIPVARGAGQLLGGAVQSRMETLLQASLAGVRIYQDPAVAALGAFALTEGSDLFFAPGRYDPASPHGDRLLAHELAHVVQQRTGRLRGPLASGPVLIHDPALEAEAERFALKAMRSRSTAGLERAVSPRAVQAHPARSVVQRAMFEDLPNEVILYILTFLDLRPELDPYASPDEGLSYIMAFSLVSKRMHGIANHHLPFWTRRNITGFRPLALPGQPVDPVGELGTNIATYPHLLEPVRHGGHLESGRVGFPGVTTVLAVLHQGRLLPWSLTAEEARAFSRSPEEVLAMLEVKVQKQVDTYARLMGTAEQVKVVIRQQVGGENAERLINSNELVIRAREASPVELFQRVLIQNLARYRPAPGFGSSLHENEKLRHHHVGMTRLLNAEDAQEDYAALAATSEEVGAYGHSEQLWMVSRQWLGLLRQLLAAADRVMICLRSNFPLDVAQQRITLFCNRSPCTSCGRYLVVELENFWRLLKRRFALRVDDDTSRRFFSQIFSFTLVYTSLYKDKGKKQAYPNAEILNALQRAGWKLEYVQALASKERKAGCLSGSTVEKIKIDTKELKRKAEELERKEDYQADLDPEELQRLLANRRTSSRKRQKKSYKESEDSGEEGEGKDKGK